MILHAFSVYDAKADLYSPPFFMAAIGLAVRSFTDAVNDPGTQLHRHPDDFFLRLIGSFEDSRGELAAINYQSICCARDVLRSQPALPVPSDDALLKVVGDA